MTSDPLPLYKQIIASLLDSILIGKFSPGDQIPSQRELCQKYHASLMTMRRVLDELKREGFLKSIPGKGIFVSKRTIANEYGTLLGFETQMSRLGIHPYSKTLEAKIISANTFIANMLRVLPGSQLVYIFRLRFANDIPMSIYKAYIPHSLCPGILDKGLAAGSLFSILRSDYNLELVGSRNTATAILPDEEALKYLNLSSPTALLLREQITFLNSGEIIEYSRNLTPGESFCVQYDEGKVF